MSSGFKLLPLDSFIEAKGEFFVKEELSRFSCPLNPDVEHFLRNTAITFSQQSLSRTTLVYSSYKDEHVLVGYFTLAMKYITVKRENVNYKDFKRLKKFGSFIHEANQVSISAPLIAQLGKNFTNDYNKLITGDELLGLALRQVKTAQNILGGKAVYPECEDIPAIMDFYSRNGFREFDKRYLDKDETGIKGEYLCQMLRVD